MVSSSTWHIRWFFSMDLPMGVFNLFQDIRWKVARFELSSVPDDSGVVLDMATGSVPCNCLVTVPDPPQEDWFSSGLLLCAACLHCMVWMHAPSADLASGPQRPVAALTQSQAWGPSGDHLDASPGTVHSCPYPLHYGSVDLRTGCRERHSTINTHSC